MDDAYPLREQIVDMRETIAAIRAAAVELHGALADAPRIVVEPASRRAHGEEMTRSLADRDRQVAEVQFEADQRLALIEDLTREAHSRLEALDETTVAMYALEAQLERATEQLASALTENGKLRFAANERLELLQANHQEYEHFKATLRGRLAEITDMIV